MTSNRAVHFFNTRPILFISTYFATKLILSLNICYKRNKVRYSAINKTTQLHTILLKKKKKIMKEKKAIYFVSPDWSRVVNQQKRISHRLKRRPTGTCNFSFPRYIWKNPWNRFGVNLTLNFVERIRKGRETRTGSILFLNSLPSPSPRAS